MMVISNFRGGGGEDKNFYRVNVEIFPGGF